MRGLFALAAALAEPAAAWWAAAPQPAAEPIERLERLRAAIPGLQGSPRAPGDPLAGVLAAQRDIGRFIGVLAVINAGVTVAVAAGLQVVGLPNPLLGGAVCSVPSVIPRVGPVVVVVLLAPAGHGRRGPPPG